MIATIVVGFFIGMLAKLFMPGRDPGGLFITIALGIGGSSFAAWIGQQVGHYPPGETASFLASVGGAMLILLIYRLLIGRA